MDNQNDLDKIVLDFFSDASKGLFGTAKHIYQNEGFYSVEFFWIWPIIMGKFYFIKID